jgi:diaminopimelate epimerase
VRPVITGENTCRVAMGRASLTSRDFPGGPPDGRGEVAAGGRTWAFQHVSIGNPQCAIEVDDPDALDIVALGSEIEHAPLFPNRTNVSFWRARDAGTIRARIFERGVGETMASGTGACGAAVAHVLRGGTSPVTVELDGGELTVAISGELDVELTGWAEPVYEGRLSDEVVAALAALD